MSYFKHNISHKFIESSWTVSMRRKSKYTSVCQNLYPSPKLSPNPVHTAYMSCNHSGLVLLANDFTSHNKFRSLQTTQIEQQNNLCMKVSITSQYINPVHADF